MSKEQVSKIELDKNAQAVSQSISNFVVSLAKESERISIVMGVAQIDLTLERLLKTLLFPDSGGKDNLFDPDKPVATFSAKIALSFRIGVIDSDFEHVLQMMRKIRNDFAHSIQTETLSDSRHRCRLKELTGVMKSDKLFIQMSQLLLDKQISLDLANFCAAVTVVLTELELAIMKNVRVQQKHIAQFRN